MKITLYPVFDPARELDVTRSLVAAIAEELWNCYGGTDSANWVEAEMHVQRLLEGPRVPSMVRDSQEHDAALSRRLRDGKGAGSRGRTRRTGGRSASHRARANGSSLRSRN